MRAGTSARLKRYAALLFMKRTIVYTLMLLVTAASPAYAEDEKPHRLAPVPIQQVVIQDAFWSPKLKVWREITIPDCLAKFEQDGGELGGKCRISAWVTPSRTSS